MVFIKTKNGPNLTGLKFILCAYNWSFDVSHEGLLLNTIYWESFMEENIHKFCGFWNDRKCFLATIFYLVIILT